MSLDRELADIRKRLAALEGLETSGIHFLGAGTSFPASPPTNGVYFRTDLGWQCYYDGAQWLTTHEYVVLPALAPTSCDFAANDGTAHVARMRTDYVPYFTRAALTTRVLTTNNGTNFWTVVLAGYNLSFGSFTNIVSYTTASDTAGTYTTHEGAVSTANPANNTHVALSVTKTLTPGTLRVFWSLYYKLIVT